MVLCPSFCVHLRAATGPGPGERNGLLRLREMVMAVGVSRKRVFEKTGGRCSYCGKELDPFEFHREHAIPASRGGPNRTKNIVPSCKTCNSRKRHRTLAEFRDYIRDYPIGLLDDMKVHFDKYLLCLPNSEHLMHRIEDASFELRRLLMQLEPEFYIDTLAIDLFMDVDLENYNG